MWLPDQICPVFIYSVWLLPVISPFIKYKQHEANNEE